MNENFEGKMRGSPRVKYTAAHHEALVALLELEFSRAEEPNQIGVSLTPQEARRLLTAVEREVPRA